MIDYTNSKQQALYGYTSNGSLVHIILNENKEFIYFRLDGNISKIRDMGVPIKILLKENDNLSDDYRIIYDNTNFNYAKNNTNNRQYLIGKNAKAIKTVIIFDEKGKTIGYKNL